MNEENQDNYQNNQELSSAEKDNTSKDIGIATVAVASLIGGGIGVVAASSTILGAATIGAGVASGLKMIQRRRKEKKATQNPEVE
ncbi:hypothetical protein [Dapis sp. BLCC M172]|uniref:hypothetical protein n=1 Tax=Dapis sp. BLCC M172 TaxID=2975281 RepID=UPI003CF14340